MKYIILILLIQSSFGFSQSILDSVSIRNISFCNYEDNNIDKPIQLDWVQTDIENIKKLNSLYVAANTINEIEKIFPNFIKAQGNCRSETYECGYGLKTTDHEFYGGYGSVHVSVLYFENKIIKLRLTIDVPREITYTYLASIIQFPVECKFNKLSYDKIIESNFQEYRTKYGNLYLAISDDNEKKKEVFNYFSDVLSGANLQKPFYILNGLGYPTFDYLRYLIVLNDHNTIKKLIYSPSPSTRLLIAKTINYIAKDEKFKLDSEDKIRIIEIIKNAEKIKGGVISCWAGKFGYDFYDVNKDFDKYLLTK